MQSVTAKMKKQGITLEIIDVDLDAFSNWCGSNRRNMNGASRSEYAAQELREKYGQA